MKKQVDGNLIKGLSCYLICFYQSATADHYISNDSPKFT